MSAFASALRVYAWCVVLGAAAGAAGVRAQTVLTLESALRAAQERSRQLPAQSAAAQAARDMAVAAGQRPDPVLRLAVSNVPVEGPARYSLSRDFMTMRSVAVMQELTRADKRSARSARLEREADVAEAARAVALVELRQATAAAWLDLLFQQRLLELQQALRAEAALQIDAAQSAYRGGRGAQADVFAAQSAVARIDDDMLQTRRDIAVAQTRLARWTGTAADLPLGAPPDLDRLPSAAAALEQWLENDPRIAQWQRREASALADAELARSNLRPDWTVELMFSQRGPAYSNMVSVNLSVPLQWNADQRQNRELAARIAAAQQLRDERDEAVRELVAQTRALIQQWQGNRVRIAHVDARLLPLAAERIRAALAAYRGGTAPLPAVLDARRQQIDLRLERLRLEMENARLWASVVYRVPDPTQDLVDTGAGGKP